MPCPICKRGRDHERVVPPWMGEPWAERGNWACSVVCLTVMSLKRYSNMIDPTESESEAIEYAGDEAGKYLNSLGKFDLLTFTREEYMTFIECVVTNFSHKLRELEIRSVEEP
jgi:hypothetical protein